MSNQLEENRFNLSMLSVIFLFLNKKFVEVGSGEMQYEEANINLKIDPKINQTQNWSQSWTNQSISGNVTRIPTEMTSIFSI